MVTRAPRRTDRKVNLIAAVVGLLCVIAAIVVVLVATSPSSKRTAPAQHACRQIGNSESPFACSSVWNATLPANAPLAARSSQYTAQLLAQVKADGGWINTYSSSVPVYTVGRNQPRVPVTLDISGPGPVAALALAFKQGVPIPAGAKAAAGEDQHMVIWQPSTDTMWEFWHAQQVNGAWHARWGGKMTNVSSNPGYFPNSWGATATSLPLMGGLIGIRELESGHIDHALALAIPHTAAGVVAYPAQRSDGDLHSPDAIPEGTRFRLNPRIDVAALNLPPVVRVVAEAVQRYGMIVRDKAGTVTLYGQDPTPLGYTPYYGAHGLFDGMSPATLMRDFPWQDLQAVRPAKLSG